MWGSHASCVTPLVDARKRGGLINVPRKRSSRAMSIRVGLLGVFLAWRARRTRCNQQRSSTVLGLYLILGLSVSRVRLSETWHRINGPCLVVVSLVLWVMVARIVTIKAITPFRAVVLGSCVAGLRAAVRTHTRLPSWPACSILLIVEYIVQDTECVCKRCLTGAHGVHGNSAVGGVPSLGIEPYSTIQAFILTVADQLAANVGFNVAGPELSLIHI